MASVTVAAIVPALNEEATIGALVAVLKHSPLLSEVIVVSDGSTDRTAECAQLAGAKVFALSKTRGKGAALRYGVLRTTAQVVVFFDADLIGLSTKHIDQLVRPVVEGRCAMFAGYHDRGFLTRCSRQVLLTGQRALKRSIFLAIPEEYLAGYAVEVALNYYCKIHRLVAKSTVLYGLDFRRKIRKVGAIRGVWQYLSMWGAVLKGAGRVRIAHLFGKL